MDGVVHKQSAVEAGRQCERSLLSVQVGGLQLTMSTDWGKRHVQVHSWQVLSSARRRTVCLDPAPHRQLYFSISTVSLHLAPFLNIFAAAWLTSRVHPFGACMPLWLLHVASAAGGIACPAASRPHLPAHSRTPCPPSRISEHHTRSCKVLRLPLALP